MSHTVAVLVILRKSVQGFQSIERVFQRIAGVQPPIFQMKFFEVSRATKGFLSLLRNMAEVTRQKALIYHISGDIHYVAAFLPGSRTILTIHDLGFLKTNKGIKRTCLKWLFLDMPVRKVKLVTTISEATRQEILRYTACDPAKVVVIPNPVDSLIRYVPKEFRAYAPHILFVGTRPNKNLERAITSLSGIDCTLIIVGELSEAQKVLLREYGVRYVQYFNIPDKDLADLYENADIVLFPSLFEGFGLPILEGQQAGKIVVTSDIAPMSVVAGSGAIKVDPLSVVSIREGVKMAMSDAQLRQATIQKGFENIIQYSAKAIAIQYKELYDLIQYES